MKASEITKAAIEQYRSEVSGGGVNVKVPELFMDFYVFPAQPEETAFLMKLELSHDVDYAIGMICSRAKKADGSSLFDNENERMLTFKAFMKTVPMAFNQTVAARVINDIQSAYPITTIEEAGNESNQSHFSDSTST